MLKFAIVSEVIEDGQSLLVEVNSGKQTARIPLYLYCDDDEYVDGVIVPLSLRSEAIIRYNCIKDLWPTGRSLSFKGKTEYVLRRITSKWGYDTTPDFFHFTEQLARDYISLGKTSRADKLFRLISRVRSLKGGILPFHMISRAFVNRFFQYLQAEHEIVVNHYYSKKQTMRRETCTHLAALYYMKELRSVITHAKELYPDCRHLFQSNIFLDTNFGELSMYERNYKRAVPVELLRNIVHYKPQTNVEVLGRNYFLLSFFLCGMNYKDIVANFTNRKKGEGTMSFYRRKELLSRGKAPLLELKIYKELEDMYEECAAISIGNNMNRIITGLKQIKQNLGYKGALTFYSARHSFATIAYNDLHATEQLVAKSLSHSVVEDSCDFYVKRNYNSVFELQDRMYQYIMNGARISEQE